jgi:hypothetical protein
MKNIVFTVELDNGKIYIAEENSSGVEYEGTTAEDVGFAVECYVADYINK